MPTVACSLKPDCGLGGRGAGTLTERPFCRHSFPQPIALQALMPPYTIFLCSSYIPRATLLLTQPYCWRIGVVLPLDYNTTHYPGTMLTANPHYPNRC